MGKILNVFLLSTLALSAFNCAAQSSPGNGYGLWRTNYANGGAGLAGKHGRRGMNGCPGGTAPSADGRYYLPGTHEECHHAHQGASRQNRHSFVAQGYERA